MITLTINDLNDETPVITSAASFAVDEGETAVATLTAADADEAQAQASHFQVTMQPASRLIAQPVF